MNTSANRARQVPVLFATIDEYELLERRIKNQIETLEKAVSDHQAQPDKSTEMLLPTLTKLIHTQKKMLLCLQETRLS